MTTLDPAQVSHAFDLLTLRAGHLPADELAVALGVKPWLARLLITEARKQGAPAARSPLAATARAVVAAHPSASRAEIIRMIQAAHPDANPNTVEVVASRASRAALRLP
jgi:hypothetical protein